MKQLLLLALVAAYATACTSNANPESSVYEAQYGQAYVYGKDSADHRDQTRFFRLQAVLMVDGNRTLTEVTVPRRVYLRVHVGDSIPSIMY